MTIAELNQQYAIPGQVEFSIGQGGLPIAVLTNQYATAVISLYGAHVQHFMPAGEKDLLWMSEQSAFEEGKAIRGGIPVCFPWFGPNATDNTKPQHGFARLSNWSVQSTSVEPGVHVKLVLQLKDSPATLALWPYSFNAELTVIVDKKLDVSLQVTNTGNESFEYTDALHTYFNISDVSNISIDGLLNANYMDPSGPPAKPQTDKLLAIQKEENRRYIDHSGDCLIADNGLDRKIRVSKTGSNVTVVWNPGAATARGIADMADDGYKTFICVEPANAFSNIIKLAPGESFALSTTIGIEK